MPHMIRKAYAWPQKADKPRHARQSPSCPTIHVKPDNPRHARQSPSCPTIPVMPDNPRQTAKNKRPATDSTALDHIKAPTLFHHPKNKDLDAKLQRQLHKTLDAYLVSNGLDRRLIREKVLPVKGPRIGRHAHDATDAHANGLAFEVGYPAARVALRAVLPSMPYLPISMKPGHVGIHHEIVREIGDVKVCDRIYRQFVEVRRV